MQKTVISNQTMLDISLQEYGSVMELFELAKSNDLSITETLVAGTKLQVDDILVSNTVNQQYLKKNNKIIASFKGSLNAIQPAFFISEAPINNLPFNVISKQTTLDIAIQETGGLASLITLCNQNNISITDALVVGETLDVSNTVTDEDVLNYYKNNKLTPATGITFISTVDTSLFAFGLFETGLFE